MEVRMEVLREMSRLFQVDVPVLWPFTTGIWRDNVQHARRFAMSKRGGKASISYMSLPRLPFTPPSAVPGQMP